MAIGDRIKEFREKKELSQQQLAEAINKQLKTTFKRNTISNYENGVSKPSARVLSSISQILNVPFENFIRIGFEQPSEEELLKYAGSIMNFKPELQKYLTEKFKISSIRENEIYKIILEDLWSSIDNKKSKKLALDSLRKQFLDHKIISKLLLQEMMTVEDAIETVGKFIKYKNLE
jgi:transcriptional regulator with XRE-family HTH domain